MSGRRGGDIWKSEKPQPWRPTRQATDEEIRRAARTGKKTILRPDPDEKRDAFIREFRQAIGDS